MGGRLYQIEEYGFLATTVTPDGVCLPQTSFSLLEKFILTEKNEASGTDFMSLSARKHVGKIITAKNYVGAIFLPNGDIIEILPKIFSKGHREFSAQRVKKLLLSMLETLRDFPFRVSDFAGVNLENMNIFDIFIRMFTTEILSLVKQGLKCNYESVAENTTFFKGKLLVAQHVKHNHSHLERSFVVYDAYTANRAENRLIKSTLALLYRICRNSKTKTILKTLLNCFHEIPLSKNYAKDFDSCVSTRNMASYAKALQWCRIFLAGKSFTPYSGENNAFALLFPMETLFESYVAACLKKILPPQTYTLTLQDSRYCLFDTPRRFQMRPDIVVQNNCGLRHILDTKWKLLDETRYNYGIAQADMYQMYTYQRKYNAANVTVIYPFTNKVASGNNIAFTANDGTEVRIFFVDLFDEGNSLSQLKEKL